MDAPLTQAQSSDHFQIIVGGIVAVLVVLLPLMFTSIRTNGKVNRIRAQVENDHSTNLREENDERHHENSSRGERLEQKVDTIFELVAGLQKGQGRLYDLIVGNTNRIDDIEHTINPHEQETPWTPSRPSRRPWQPEPSPASPRQGRHSQTE